jgi:hypothetical protein
VEKHPYFDLWLHSNDELGALLAVEVLERETLHDWPLSCVQLLHLADGRQLIYKSQDRRGTVEPEFYASVGSSLLPRYWNLGNFNGSVTMAFEFIDAPLLIDLNVDERTALHHLGRLMALIGQIDGDPPVYADIGTPHRWLLLVDETLDTLEGLIAQGQFHFVQRKAVWQLNNWARSSITLAAIQSRPGVIHGDLTPENIFVTPDGYRVIDWQRPKRAPVDLDEINFLDAQGYDPLGYKRPALVGLYWFLQLHWFVTCKATLFPQGEVYDEEVAALAGKIIQLE